MVRRTRKERLTNAIGSAEELHAERIEWLREHVAGPVLQECGLEGPFTDADEAGQWVVAQVRGQVLDGDRFSMYVPASTALSELMDGIQHHPELLGLMRNTSVGRSKHEPGTVRVDGYTGSRHPLDHFDVARAGRGLAFRDFTRDAVQRPHMQPLARLALASLIVERLTMCAPAEASLFLLADVEPPFRPITADVMFSWGDTSPSTPAVFTVADPWTTAEQVGALIASTRDKTPVGEMVASAKRLRRPDPALDYLIDFVDERRPVKGKSSQNMTWAEVTAEWDRTAPAEYRDRVSKNLRRAYSDAVALRVEKGLLQAKGGAR